MSENAIQVGQSIAEAPQAAGVADPSGTITDDQQLQPLAGQSQQAANDNAEGETTEEAVERMIHGMSAEQVLAALEEGVIPEELYEHLRFKVRIDGQDEEVPLHEHRGERMRLSDYSRNMQKLKNERQSFEQQRDDFAGMVESWKNKDPMHVTRTLEMLENLGLPIHELTSIYAQRHTEQQALIEAVPEHLRPMYKALMAEREEMRRSLAQLKLQGQAPGQQRKQEPSGAEAVARDRITRMAPAAFKAEKLADSERNRRDFYQHLGNIWDRQSELTQEHVRQAAKAVREDLERDLKSMGWKPGDALPANDNGTPRPRVAPVQPQASTVRRAATQAPRNPSGANGTSNAVTLDQLRERWNR